MKAIMLDDEDLIVCSLQPRFKEVDIDEEQYEEDWG